MNRKNFLRTSVMAGVGLSLFPSIGIAMHQNTYTREQLIGKGNPEISGESYTTTMHNTVTIAFEKMKQAAAKDGIQIEIVSAYRSFERQKEIYERKYKQFTNEGLTPEEAISKIIEYSTIPGTSRHHWGTDLDIIDAVPPRPESVLQAKHFHGTGPFCKMKEWLNMHAESFGFYEVYTNNANRTGFKYEPWHFSYAEISKPMLTEYMKLDVKNILQEEKIAGSEHFTDDFITLYRKQNILDINPNLLP